MTETNEETTTKTKEAIDPSKIDDLITSFAKNSTEETGSMKETGEEYDENPVSENMHSAVHNLKIRERAMRMSAPRERVHEQIGISATDGMRAVNDAGDAASEDEEYHELRRYAKNQEILYGIMAGCEYITWKNDRNDKNGKLVMSVYLPKFPTAQVMIREEEYWTEGTTFGSSYAGLKEMDQIARRRANATTQMFARIPLILLSVRREKTTDYSTGQTPYTIYLEASRRQAMDSLMHTWFFNSHANAPKVTMDGVYKANVLQVQSDAVKVECCGVESWIPAWDITSTAYIENVTEFVENGALIMVKPKKIVIHHQGDPILSEKREETGAYYERDTVTFKVSGRLYDSAFDAKALSSIRLNGMYAGTVRRFNRAEDKNVYTVILLNGVTAAVHAGAVEGGYSLSTGDSVIVTVTEIKDRYVRGRARLCGRRTAGRKF